MEMWNLTEIRLSLYVETEFKHKLSDEFSMYRKLRELYSLKMERLSKVEEKKNIAFEFEKNFIKMAKDSDLLTEFQARMNKAQNEAKPPEVKKNE